MSKKTVYFYCAPPGIPDSKETVYQHVLVALAEGFKALGIPFYSNRNFWKTGIEDNNYLFRYNPDISPDHCSVVILHTAWFTYGLPIPEGLFHPERSYTTVYFESEADAKHGWKPEFRQFDFIFRCHYNTRFKYPKNFYPWAFGLSNRILHELEDLPPFAERSSNVLFNFRIRHPIRTCIQEQLLPPLQSVLSVDNSVDPTQSPPSDPYDFLQWTQTDRRHYPAYYKRLRSSSACACFGGLLINPWPLDAFGPSTLWDRVINKIFTWVDSRPRRIMNWESWRFWEAMAAGSVVLHVDLEKYGALLPEMPQNWRHYIGVDLENLQDTVERIKSEPDLLEKISSAGRIWSLQHYSPVPTARRFLSILNISFDELNINE
jgi:Glycosyl transferases group 1